MENLRHIHRFLLAWWGVSAFQMRAFWVDSHLTICKYLNSQWPSVRFIFCYWWNCPPGDPGQRQGTVVPPLVSLHLWLILDTQALLGSLSLLSLPLTSTDCLLCLWELCVFGKNTVQRPVDLLGCSGAICVFVEDPYCLFQKKISKILSFCPTKANFAHYVKKQLKEWLIRWGILSYCSFIFWATPGGGGYSAEAQSGVRVEH